MEEIRRTDNYAYYRMDDQLALDHLCHEHNAAMIDTANNLFNAIVTATRETKVLFILIVVALDLTLLPIMSTVHRPPLTAPF